MKKILGIFLISISVFATEITPVNEDGEANPSLNCTVQTGSAMIYYGSRCPYMDDVMVGIDRLTPQMAIRCARLRVTCRGSVDPKSTVQD